VLIFQVSKKLSKKSKIAKNNRKRTAIILHQKFLIIAKKIESIGSDHYRIALITYSLHNNYRKMSSMRLPSLLITPSEVSILLPRGGDRPPQLATFLNLPRSAEFF